MTFKDIEKSLAFFVFYSIMLGTLLENLNSLKGGGNLAIYGLVIFLITAFLLLILSLFFFDNGNEYTKLIFIWAIFAILISFSALSTHTSTTRYVGSDHYLMFSWFMMLYITYINDIFHE